MESHGGMESHGASSGVSPPAINLAIGPRRGVENATHPAHRFAFPEVRLVETTCLTLVLISAAISHGGEPPSKPMLKIALDGGQESQILKAELTRDWRPNQSVCSTPDAYSRADANLRPLREIQRRIFDKFCVTFVTHPQGVDCPAVLIGGKWEQLNPWAFTCETRCLLTLDWMIRRREWWTSDARDSSPNGDSKDKSLSEEDGGWSGGDDGSVECAPPWAPPLKPKQKQRPQPAVRHGST
jgi:hypothetical protein